MDESEMEETNSNNNDLLLEIADELNLIIDYIQSNSEKLDKRETDSGEENSRGDNFLLGIKRKNPIELFENENDINSKEFQDKNEKEIIILYTFPNRFIFIYFFLLKIL